MRGFGRAPALSALLLAGAAAGLGRAEDAPPELFGKTVESVAFTCDGPADRREIQSLIVLSPGRPLSEGDTGATIQNLFATLDFSDVVVTAELTWGGGVAVTVNLWRSFRVRSIEIEGKAALSREEIRRAIPFSERDPFYGAALTEGAAALERRIAREGYLHATVDPEVTFDGRTFEATVVYRIDAGERARVAAPFFDGSTEPFTPEDLLSKTKLKPGAPYRESRARDDAERIRKFLLDRGYFRASVELIAAEPTGQAGVRPVYRIRVGPQFTFEVAGIKEKRVRSEIRALLEGQGFDADLLAQWADTTRETLQREGHYRARVAATTEGSDPVVVKVSVDPGAKYAIQKITFAGNASVSEKVLRGLIATREKGLPLLQKGRLIDGELERDTSAILGYYQTRGWIDVRLAKPSIVEGTEPDLLDLTFAITEGPRTFVEKRTVLGAEHLGAAEIDSLLTVREGQPFNPSAVRQDVAALATRYANTGWREASVQERWTLSPDKTKVDVVYTVVEGMRTFFGKTIVRGNAVTDPERILRQVAWKEGQPFSEEKIADTQRNLARTGAFRSIEVQPQPVDPQNETHNVDIELTESRRISLLYGVGYQYASGASTPNDPFATVGLTYRNLFGRMQSASIEVQYAPVSQRGYAVASFVEPYLFDTEIPFTSGAFISREPVQDIDINRYGVFLESVRQFGHLRAGARYSYQYIAPNNPEDLSTIVLQKFPRSAFPIKQSAIGPNFLYDWRDDVLNPQKGYYVTVAGNYAFPFVNATAHYGKVSGQAAWFKSMFGGVLAASFRLGGLFPVGVAGAQTVPIPEKFFAGGSSTARGFDTDLEGIPAGPTTPPGGTEPLPRSDITLDYDTQATLHTGSGIGSCAALYPDLPQYDCSPGPRIVGGNGFMAAGLEYRIPIAGNLGISVFYDLAQVWATPGRIHLALEGQTGLRQSVGVGLHYMTPIGPLRLEVGRPVQLRTIHFDVTTTEGKVDGQECSVEHPCTLATTGQIKETGRIFLSIGYPF